jgi:LmbE family N-acetylglucosaminyl deacetylase
MLGVNLNVELRAPLRLLCLGAHSDDIEIGCGGTILELIAKYPQVAVHWIVFASSGRRTEEAHASANQFLTSVEDKKIIIKDFRDGYFPYTGRQIKDYFEQLKQEVSPDIVFTHYRHDLHQDHRLICELTWNTFRNHLILEYELPKYDGDSGAPNLFVHLDVTTCQRKVKYLMDHFASQRDKDWFTEDAFLSLMRLRGVESKSAYRYAEAFYCRKILLLG